MNLYYEDKGDGVPILLVPPAGATASTWGSLTEELARIERVITYDRRGYARTGGAPVHSVATHTADAAALLDHLHASPAVVVGTSAGGSIAIDLAIRRPDLVAAVVSHEAAWRAARHVPTAAQVATFAKIGWFALIGRHSDAAETLLRFAYSYPDGATAWDWFPEEWRQIARENAKAALADFRNSIGNYPTAADLATITAPVVCSYGARSVDGIVPLTQALAAAIPTARLHRIEGAGHAAPFDSTATFVELIEEMISPQRAADAK